MKLNEKAIADASAVWMGVVYLFCGVAIALFPELSRNITQSWFHGFDISAIWSAHPFPGSFLMGLASAVILTWVATWFFALLYNYFLKGK